MRTTIDNRRSARTAAAAPESAGDDLAPVFDAVARYFGLLAEPTRLRIMHVICRDERSVSEIVVATGASQTNVSRHLARMLQAGVVRRRRAGSVVYYRVADDEIVEICRAVCVRIASRIEDQKPLRRGLLQFAAGH